MTRRRQETPEKIPVAEVIKELTGEDIYSSEGIGWLKIRCPFPDHTDRRASASVNYTHFKCFACGIEGDAYDLIMQVEGVDFPVAKQRAQAISGIEVEGPRRKRRRSSELLGYSRNIS